MFSTYCLACIFMFHMFLMFARWRNLIATSLILFSIFWLIAYAHFIRIGSSLNEYYYFCDFSKPVLRPICGQRTIQAGKASLVAWCILTCHDIRHLLFLNMLLRDDGQKSKFPSQLCIYMLNKKERAPSGALLLY